MLYVDKLKITDQYGLDFLDISFTLKDNSEDITNYQFNLLRSMNEASDYALVVTDIENFSYTDSTVNLYNPAIRYYYKIEIVNKSTGEKSISDAVEFITNEPDEYGNALIHINKTYLEGPINNDIVYVLKRKKAGELCSCYDDVRGRSSKINCEICYGTKYVGGYFAPQELNVSYMNSAGKVPRFEMGDVGETETPIQLWTSNYPLIQNDDIIVDKNNTRYIVNNWQPTFKNFYLLKQVIQMQRVPRSNVIYKIPMKTI